MKRRSASWSSRCIPPCLSGHRRPSQNADQNAGQNAHPSRPPRPRQSRFRHDTLRICRSGCHRTDRRLSIVDDSHPPLRRTPSLLALPTLGVAAARGPRGDLWTNGLDFTRWNSSHATSRTRPRSASRWLYLWSPRLAFPSDCTPGRGRHARVTSRQWRARPLGRCAQTHTRLARSVRVPAGPHRACGNHGWSLLRLYVGVRPTPSRTSRGVSPRPQRRLRRARGHRSRRRSAGATSPLCAVSPTTTAHAPWDHRGGGGSALSNAIPASSSCRLANPLELGRTNQSSTIGRIAAMCSGVEPQQAPITSMPMPRISVAHSAITSGAPS